MVVYGREIANQGNQKEYLYVLRVNRQRQVDTLNCSHLIKLREKLYLLQCDRQNRVAIINGTFEKAFCQGIDLKERVQKTRLRRSLNMRKSSGLFY